MSSDSVNGGNWFCSRSGSDWITFSCVDLRPFQGCLRYPSMVDYFLDTCLCTRSNDRPGQEVNIFFVISFPRPD